SQDAWPSGASLFRRVRRREELMVRSRIGTAAAVHFSLLLSVISMPVVLRAADDAVAGAVVDQSGQALPRAYVRVLDSASREQAAAFADQAGRFHLNVPSLDCRITASLTGFETATVPCAAKTVRIVLAVAP